MKLQEMRRERNIEQLDLATRVGTNAPMMSNFERYKCIPTPEMLNKICEILNCQALDIYDESELFVIVSHAAKAGSKKTKNPSFYRLTADLPGYARDILCARNLEKCGYHSLKDFIWHCFKRFEKKLQAVNKKATKHSNCSAAKENGYENELSHQ